jgi:hypothetical protein
VACWRLFIIFVEFPVSAENGFVCILAKGRELADIMMRLAEGFV